jgi:hypothetical protein
VAAETLPAPGAVVRGVEVGPCEHACKHSDCAETRAMAAALCELCGKPIGYDVPMYADNATDGCAVGCPVKPERRNRWGLIHATCHEARTRKRK